MIESTAEEIVALSTDHTTLMHSWRMVRTLLTNVKIHEMEGCNCCTEDANVALSATH